MRTAALWASAGALALLAAAGANSAEVWVGNQRTGTVQIVDGASLALVAEIPVGLKPHNVAFSHDGHRAYVANLRSGDVSVVDADARRVVATLPAGKITHHVALSPDGRLLFVAVRGEDRVIVFDAASLQPVKSIPVGKNPGMTLFTPDGARAYVNNAGEASVSIIDVGRLEVTGRIADVGGWTGDMAITRDGKRLIVTAGASDRYALIDASADRVMATGVGGQGPHGVALTPDGVHALVVNSLSGDLTVVDMATGESVETIADLGDKPAYVDVSPDGRYAFVTLIGERAAGDPPNRLSGHSPGLAVVDLAQKKVARTIPLGGDPLSVTVRP
ncbi:MAG TPA: cytochrome D1 domain-containing protein [Burkholderiales bacterium]|nr:cytochrome D1 domain-containing protein [Burkholderiales bacterium]